MKIINKLIKTCRFLLMFLLVFIIMINIIGIFRKIVLKQDVPMILGYGSAVVQTGSMMPSIVPGDIIVISKEKNYQVGDIVTYQENHYVTHRIVKMTTSGYITQGDANNTPDNEISGKQIIGKVVAVIPRVGFVMEFMKSPFGILVMIVGLFIVNESIYLLRKRKK